MSLPTALLVMGGLQALLLFFHGSYIAVAHGLRWGMGRRSQAIGKTDLDRRIERSIANTVESLAAFLPVCGAALYLNADGPIYDAAALAYVVARLGFVATYLANIPYVRTAFWLLGQGAIVVLFATCFGALGGLG